MSKAKKPAVPMAAGLTFERLVLSIRGIDSEMAAQAGCAVDVSLTLRNWLIGCYIAEYELLGADRAQYGERLLANLSVRLTGLGVSRAEERQSALLGSLHTRPIPQIRESLTAELKKRLALTAIKGHATIRESATPESRLSGKEVVTKLSFTHIAELLAIQDLRKCSFYETKSSASAATGRWRAETTNRLALLRALRPLSRQGKAGRTTLKPNPSPRSPVSRSAIPISLSSSASSQRR